MRGITEFIKEHDGYLKESQLDGDKLAYHLIQIQLLQHERLVHLLVMLFVAWCALLCLGVYLYVHLFLLLIAFMLLLILSLFYILHYYRLENTVIRWYFVYNDHIQIPNHQSSQ